MWGAVDSVRSDTWKSEDVRLLKKFERLKLKYLKGCSNKHRACEVLRQPKYKAAQSLTDPVQGSAKTTRAGRVIGTHE